LILCADSVCRPLDQGYISITSRLALNNVHCPAPLLQEYCVSREQLDYVLDVTTFKSKSPWNADPLAEVAPTTKAALTR
jgi:hypothetical protein